jgi:hypothetical protein
MGDEPSQLELLDWLASEWARQKWSLKRMHRQLVTSAVYRQASRPEVEGLDSKQARATLASWRKTVAADPENRLLGRMSRRRLEGEAIRDAMLASAERLDAGRGGPGIMAPLPKEMLANILRGQWTVSEKEQDHRRRSIYSFVRRNLRYPLFEAFDRPDTNVSCPRRNVSTTAPQALVLLNSEFSLASAGDLAAYLFEHEPSDATRRIELLYERTLCRLPTQAEISSAQEFLASQARRIEQAKGEKLSLPAAAKGDKAGSAPAPAEAAAFVELCLTIFNLNEFVYLD